MAASQQAIATVDGWPINVPDLDSGVTEIIRAAKRRESFAVFTLNLDHLDKLRRSASFRAAYAQARYVAADGAPIAMLASRQGARVQRTAGSDMIVPLAQAAAQQGISIYLYGTTQEVLAQSGAILASKSGGTLTIAGADSPAHRFDPEGDEADAALDRIAASGAGLCFVALGAPKQELFAARAVGRDIKTGFICIGAGLDFLAGTQRRAPGFMQRHGLEWFWRLATNPRRLTTRYARCAIVFAKVLLASSRNQRA